MWEKTRLRYRRTMSYVCMTRDGIVERNKSRKGKGDWLGEKLQAQLDKVRRSWDEEIFNGKNRAPCLASSCRVSHSFSSPCCLSPMTGFPATMAPSWQRQSSKNGAQSLESGPCSVAVWHVCWKKRDPADNTRQVSSENRRLPSKKTEYPSSLLSSSWVLTE